MIRWSRDIVRWNLLQTGIQIKSENHTEIYQGLMQMTLGVVQVSGSGTSRDARGPIRPRIKQCLEYSPQQREADHFHLMPRLQCVELQLNSPYIFTAWYILINISFPYRRLADKPFSFRVFLFHKTWAIFWISKSLCVSHGLTAPVNAQLRLANAIYSTLSLSGKRILLL